MMWSVSPSWAVVGMLLAGAWAQEENAECTCSGLDYADGGSYLVDGNSENEFTFYSVFQGIRGFQSGSQTREAKWTRLLRILHHSDPRLAGWRWLRMLTHRFSA